MTTWRHDWVGYPLRIAAGKGKVFLSCNRSIARQFLERFVPKFDRFQVDC